jgi:hypothetical protein
VLHPSSVTATCNGHLGFRIELDWSAGDDEDQVTLRLQSQLMVTLSPSHDAISVDLTPKGEEVGVEMRVVRRREHRLPVLWCLVFRCRATLRKRCCIACPQGEGGVTTAVARGVSRSRRTCSTASSPARVEGSREERGYGWKGAPTPLSLFSMMFTESTGEIQCASLLF